MTAPLVRFTLQTLALAVAGLWLHAQPASAQRHSGLSSPPTAPPALQAHDAQHIAASSGAMAATWAPVSPGLGAIEFYSVNLPVAAPQSLVRQLTAEDDRTRRSALSDLGAPLQYVQKNAASVPHSILLELAQLGSSDEMDALVTVELDHHLVTAILAPSGSSWHRIATVLFPTAFRDPNSTPSSFLRTSRSFLDPSKYRAVFRARENQPNGDFQENEAHIRVINNRAFVTVSFISASRHCESSAKKPHGSCEITRRWIEPDPTATTTSRHFQLVSSTKRIAAREYDDPLLETRDPQHQHSSETTCQPMVFSETMLRYEPSGPNGPCPSLPRAASR